jgi:sigma-B regulation protein RsbU (phosphoserine phosphatase)
MQLAPGAMLVAYSDGLSEATNESGVEYGAARLRALLPRIRGLTAEDAGIRLIEEVNHFLGEERPADDLSLLVLMRLG